MATKKPGAIRRQVRVRKALKKVAGGRPRLTIFRSSAHIYAQVIDDKRGHTVAAASSLEKDLRAKLKEGYFKKKQTLLNQYISLQDSVYREWYETGTLEEEGMFKN